MYLRNEIINNNKREFTFKEVICILLEELVELFRVMLNNISFSTSGMDENDNDFKKNVLGRWYCHLNSVLNDIKFSSDNEMNEKGLIWMNDLNLLSSSIQSIWGWGCYPNRDVLMHVYNKILLITRFIQIIVDRK